LTARTDSRLKAKRAKKLFVRGPQPLWKSEVYVFGVVPSLKRHLSEEHATEVFIAKLFVNAQMAEFCMFSLLHDGGSYGSVGLKRNICNPLACFEAWNDFVFVPLVN
jgi:hypothetical protein